MIRCLFIQGMTDYWLQRQPWKIVQRNWLSPRGWCDFLLRFSAFLGTICSGNQEGWFPCRRDQRSLRRQSPWRQLGTEVAHFGEIFSHYGLFPRAQLDCFRTTGEGARGKRKRGSPHGEWLPQKNLPEKFSSRKQLKECTLWPTWCAQNIQDCRLIYGSICKYHALIQLRSSGFLVDHEEEFSPRIPQEWHITLHL